MARDVTRTCEPGDAAQSAAEKDLKIAHTNSTVAKDVR
jgi:hypothetical protein